MSAARIKPWIAGALCLTAGILLHRSLREVAAARADANPAVVGPDPSVAERDSSASGSTRLVEVVSGLDRPLFVTHAGDGSGRLFVVEQGGRVRIVRDGRLLAAPFVDVSARLDTSGGERGLLGLAFDPDYLRTGQLYLAHTARDAVVVIRLRRAAGNPDAADPDSIETVLEMADPAGNHNGGMLLFGPDRKLWIGTGDGGAAGDPWNNAQNLGSLLGKMLRIDVAELPYRIPADNPFVGQPAARGEIWSYGLRNPWRYSFDRETGELWIGDVGQNSWEEIDAEDPAAGGGVNYGWRRLEGRHCFRPRTGCSPDGTRLPVHDYGHDRGCSVTGGYVYRGRLLPELRGSYLFGDYCSGAIWALRRGEGTNTATVVRLLDSGASISSFGEGADGEIYVCDHRGGRLLRLDRMESDP